MLTGSPGLGQTRHGVAPDGAPCRGGRRGLGPEATQGAPRSSRPIGGGCFRADCHSLRRLHPISRLSDPLWTTPHTKKGTVPFFKGLMLSTSHTTPPRTSTSTQENGSRCAAQRAGGRLAVYQRKVTAERVPLASTCVGSRSPVAQLRVVRVSCSAVPRVAGAFAALRAKSHKCPPMPS